MQYNFNLSLVPIGKSYWITATKIGSNYIKPFANPTDRYLRLSISNIIDHHKIDDTYLYVSFPNGLRLKIQVNDFDNVDCTHLYTETDIIDMFNRVSVVLTRNPMERFKSGLVQKVSELYSEILSNSNINQLDNIRFHDNVHFDITKYNVDYNLLVAGLGINPKNDNPHWKQEWTTFCNYLLNDIFNHPNADRILLEDRHTQPVYHFFHLILSGLSNWNKIKTLDIYNFNSCPELLIEELGQDEYQIRYDGLHNREEWNTKEVGDEYVTILKQVSNKRLYFDSERINQYFESAPFYVLEQMYYDILNTKQYKKIL
jgi:hypothetical protein